MNFGHRCACAICFILGMIFSMVLNQVLSPSQKFYSSTNDAVNVLSNLEKLVNKLIEHESEHQDRQERNFKSNFKNASLTITLLPEQNSSIQWTKGKTEEIITTSTSPANDLLSTKTRLLCWILTGPKNHQKKAINVKETWGKRCDKLLFISSQYDATLPTTVVKGVKEGRNGLWSKTRAAFKLIYEKYLDQVDFILKADDDTYVVVENLIHLVKNYNSSVPSYFGCHFELYNKKKNVTSNWMSGGAGYVLSRAAVKDLVEKGYKHPKCKRSLEGGPEDMNIARCLDAANVTYVDTRDKFGRYTFHGYPAKHHINPGAIPKWWLQYIKYPQKSGMDCCSENAISFHYISPQDMYLYEYLLYRLRPIGVHG